MYIVHVCVYVYYSGKRCPYFLIGFSRRPISFISNLLKIETAAPPNFIYFQPAESRDRRAILKNCLVNTEAALSEIDILSKIRCPRL